MIVDLLFLIPALYQLVALLASARRLFLHDPAPEALPPVSILKPVHGADPDFYYAIATHAAQDYPHFEILFAVGTMEDPAVPHIKRLMVAFPQVRIELIEVSQTTLNPKVGALLELEKLARYDVLLVNDGDISVPQGYLRSIVGALQQPEVGMVTCTYRARSSTTAGSFEALGVSTDFAPSTFVAPFVGVAEFAMGSTMLFRRADLQALGGFAKVADALADDYQLGVEMTRLGKKIHLSSVPVETALDAQSLGDVWQHQLRWARTIRVSRGGLIGYLGLPATFASLWALVALLTGHYWVAAVLLVMRLNVAIVGGLMAVGDRNVVWLLGLVPIRDLFQVAVWVNGLWGNTVRWGNQRLRLHPDGRIRP